MTRLVFALAVVSLAAQDTGSSVRSTSDGLQIEQSRTKTSFERTERSQSINGRLVPLEKIEERVLKDDASGKIVERIVKRYDQNGNPGPPEKTVIEVQKQGDSLTTRTTTYRGDISGNMQLAERSVTETHKSSSGSTSETVVERPTLNGGLAPVEKTAVVLNGSVDSYQESAVTYKLGENGFYEAVRVVTGHAVKNGQATDNTAQYEVGSSGRLELHGQTVKRTTKAADGSATTEVDVYGRGVAGTVGSGDSGLKLQERQVVERRASAGGSVETISVQRPTISDPGVLGPARVLSETVCKGNCQ